MCDVTHAYLVSLFGHDVVDGYLSDEPPKTPASSVGEQALLRRLNGGR